MALAAIFLGLFVCSIMKLVERKVGNKTYIDTTSSFYPTITICPCPYNPKEVNGIHAQSAVMNFTLEDIMKLPSMKDSTKAQMALAKTYSPGAKIVDLQNSTDVKNHLNLSLHDIWEEFIWLRYAPPYDVIRCVSISVPPLKPKYQNRRRTKRIHKREFDFRTFKILTTFVGI